LSWDSITSRSETSTWPAAPGDDLGAGGGIALGVAVVATAGMLATFWRPQPKKAEAAGEPAGQVHG
jgi:hypothetical protein